MPTAVRAVRHRDAGSALAPTDARADRVARQMLQAVSGPGVMTEPVDEWMLNRLGRTEDPLVGQAPRGAVELILPWRDAGP